MAVGDPRMEHGVLDEFRIAPPVPQGQGQDAHERAVAVSHLVAASAFQGGDALLEPAQRLAGLHPDIEHVAAHGVVPVAVPSVDALHAVPGVHPSQVQQGGEQAKGLGAVVAPGARLDPVMGAQEVHGRGHLDPLGKGDARRRREFVGNAQGIAHEKPPQAA